MVKRNCLFCTKRFLTKNSPSRQNRGKFCSRLCKTTWFRGKHLSLESEFRKNHIPWNKGFVGFGDIAGFRVHKKTLNTGRTRFKKGVPEFEHFRWKGSKVGKGALHDWVRKHLGTPNKCEFCSTKKGTFNWANKSRKYKRILSDWIRLCRKCHHKYDDISGKGRKKRKCV